jgi:radical SAM family uncharacterized protein
MLAKKYLKKVRKPGRYLGSEVNSRPRHVFSRRIKCRICLGFPDLYEIGMSHLGIQILYSLLNDMPHVACERVFSPHLDLEELLKKDNYTLRSLETNQRLDTFDMLGFSLQYELCFANILSILSLAHIPLRADKRKDDLPLIIGGGSSTANPEPLADFFDLFIIGDGEKSLPALIEAYVSHKKKHRKFIKKEFLATVSAHPGVYVPALYDIAYTDKGTVKAFKKNDFNAPDTINKTFITDYDTASCASRPIVPYIQAVHDRACLEIMRGCPHSCKFCQARHYYYPVRTRSPERIKQLACDIIASTGYEELSLLSLSSGDYPDIDFLFDDLMTELKNKRVSLSLPSLRVEKMIENLPFYLAKIKKSGLTFAPEAGSKRLREYIGKNINIDHLKEAARVAYKNGYRHIKLYFMIGLPTETYEDLDQMTDLIFEIAHLKRAFSKRPGQINVGIGTFIPKPHTVFERESMDTPDIIKQKQNYLSARLRRSYIKYSFTRPEVSILESSLSRGDRRLSSVIETAWLGGARFDAWSDHYDFSVWEKAFLQNGLDITQYATRSFGPAETLAWSHIALR